MATQAQSSQSKNEANALNEVKADFVRLVKDGQFDAALALIDGLHSPRAEDWRKQAIDHRNRIQQAKITPVTSKKQKSFKLPILILAIVLLGLVMLYMKNNVGNHQDPDSIAYFEGIKNQQMQRNDEVCKADAEATARDKNETGYLCQGINIKYAECMIGVDSWGDANHCKANFQYRECLILGMNASDEAECQAKVKADYEKNADKPNW